MHFVNLVIFHLLEHMFFLYLNGRYVCADIIFSFFQVSTSFLWCTLHVGQDVCIEKPLQLRSKCNIHVVNVMID